MPRGNCTSGGHLALLMMRGAGENGCTGKRRKRPPQGAPPPDVLGEAAATAEQDSPPPALTEAAPGADGQIRRLYKTLQSCVECMGGGSVTDCALSRCTVASTHGLRNCLSWWPPLRSLLEAIYLYDCDALQCEVSGTNPGADGFRCKSEVCKHDASWELVCMKGVYACAGCGLEYRRVYADGAGTAMACCDDGQNVELGAGGRRRLYWHQVEQRTGVDMTRLHAADPVLEMVVGIVHSIYAAVPIAGGAECAAQSMVQSSGTPIAHRLASLESMALRAPKGGKMRGGGCTRCGDGAELESLMMSYGDVEALAGGHIALSAVTPLCLRCSASECGQAPVAKRIAMLFRATARPMVQAADGTSRMDHLMACLAHLEERARVVKQRADESMESRRRADGMVREKSYSPLNTFLGEMHLKKRPRSCEPSSKKRSRPVVAHSAVGGRDRPRMALPQRPVLSWLDWPRRTHLLACATETVVRMYTNARFNFRDTQHRLAATVAVAVGMLKLRCGSLIPDLPRAITERSDPLDNARVRSAIVAAIRACM